MPRVAMDQDDRRLADRMSVPCPIQERISSEAGQGGVEIRWEPIHQTSLICFWAGRLCTMATPRRVGTWDWQPRRQATLLRSLAPWCLRSAFPVLQCNKFRIYPPHWKSENASWPECGGILL